MYLPKDFRPQGEPEPPVCPVCEELILEGLEMIDLGMHEDLPQGERAYHVSCAKPFKKIGAALQAMNGLFGRL